jgi:hypothetical protein
MATEERDLSVEQPAARRCCDGMPPPQPFRRQGRSVDAGLARSIGDCETEISNENIFPGEFQFGDDMDLIFKEIQSH